MVKCGGRDFGAPTYQINDKTTTELNTNGVGDF